MSLQSGHLFFLDTYIAVVDISSTK